MRGVFTASALLLSSSQLVSGYLVNPEYLDKLSLEPTTASECKLAFDLAQVQDISSTYEGLLDSLLKWLPTLLEYTNVKFEDSRFAFSTFVDKPLPGTGWDKPNFRKDYCLHIENTFLEPEEDLYERLQDTVKVGGGKDWAEGQLDALARAVLNERIGWREGDTTEESGRKLVRLAVLATDAVPHTAGDALAAVRSHNRRVEKGVDKGEIVAEPVPTGLFAEDSPAVQDENAGCTEWDYPDVADVGRALTDRGVLPVFLLSPATFTGECKAESTTPCAWKALRDRARETGDLRYLDPVLGMQLTYETLLDDMGIPGIIVMVEKDFSNYFDQMREALQSVEALLCTDGKISDTKAAVEAGVEDVVTDTKSLELAALSVFRSGDVQDVVADNDDDSTTTTTAVSSDGVDNKKISNKNKHDKHQGKDGKKSHHGHHHHHHHHHDDDDDETEEASRDVGLHHGHHHDHHDHHRDGGSCQCEDAEEPSDACCRRRRHIRVAVTVEKSGGGDCSASPSTASDAEVAATADE